MQKTTSIGIIVGLVVIAIAAGVYVRYQVLEGRTMPGPEPVIDFSSCLDAAYDLDITGNVCTTPTGQVFRRLGSVVAATPEPTETSTTTLATTTATSTAGTSTSSSTR